MAISCEWRNASQDCRASLAMTGYEDMGMQFFDAHNIFPEYFVISVPLFNDIIQNEMDEWLYMMKHSEVKEDFKSPYMRRVAERLNILKMTKAERKIYQAYRNESLKERDYIYPS